jgi:selenocysteine-specific elongation factor
MIQPFILATAGHVDHGKSALVKALTGVVPDRLPEEKARGITIDLGFAHLNLPAPPSPSQPTVTSYSCGIVDVPGHEDFVTNMVAGVGAIDLALLVVAADDGWMPQSEEHLQILQYLGVTQAVIALTKIDLATNEARVTEQIRDRLAGTAFAHAPIVPTSMPQGRGLNELRSAIASVLSSTPPPPDFSKPRLAIDRVFVLKGIGTIVTGTLAGGTLRRGDAVVLQPSGRACRIRSCQSHGEDAEQVHPGTRTALHLVDIAAQDIHRGDVVTLAALGTPSNTLDVWVDKSARLGDLNSPASRPLKSGTVVRLHLGSAHQLARVQLLEAATLAAGESCLAQLRLETPAFAFTGDRFLLRDASAQSTLAGGVVLDPDATRSHARDIDRLNHLKACAARPDQPDPFIDAALQRLRLVPAASLLVRSRFSSRQITTAMGRALANRTVVLVGTRLACARFWSARLDGAIQAIDQHHQDHPEQPGLGLTDLRATLEQDPGDAEGFDELVSALGQQGFVLQDSWIRRANHRPALPEHLRVAGQRLRDVLTERHLDPPSRAELAPDDPSRQALRYLLRSGEAVELGAEILLGNQAFALAKRRIIAQLRRQTRATVSELRQELGMHRRVLIPLLERLDRDGITIRDGDTRTLRTTRP